MVQSKVFLMECLKKKFKKKNFKKEAKTEGAPSLVFGASRRQRLEELVAEQDGRRGLRGVAVVHLAVHGRHVDRLERQVALHTKGQVFFFANIHLNVTIS